MSAAKPHSSPYFRTSYIMCYITADSCKRCRLVVMTKLHPCSEGKTGLICLDANSLLNDPEITRINDKGRVALDLLDCMEVRKSYGYCPECAYILAEKQRDEENTRGRQLYMPSTQYLGYD